MYTKYGNYIENKFFHDKMILRGGLVKQSSNKCIYRR
jgi:hypothetical protein